MNVKVRGQLIQLILESIPVKRYSKLIGFGSAIWGRRIFNKREALFFIF